MLNRVWPARILIVALLAPILADAAQVATPPQTPPPDTAPTRRTLRVLILEGEGAMNNLELKVYAPLVVEIRDDNDKPVENADVTFQLPATGPGGSFPGNQTTKVVKTNLQGQALASGFVSNRETGRFTIHVRAVSGDRFGEADVSQINALRITEADLHPKTGLRRFGWWKIGLIAGAVTATIVTIVLVKGGGSSQGSGSQTITIIPGPVTVGGR